MVESTHVLYLKVEFLRVLHVTYEYPPYTMGEVSFKVRKLVRELSEMDLDVILVHPSDLEGVWYDGRVEIWTVTKSIKTDLHIVTLAWSLAMDLVRRISEILNYYKGDVDVIHCHEWISTIPGVLTSLTFRKPLIVSVYSVESMRGDLVNLISMSIDGIEKLCFSHALYLMTDNDKTYSNLMNMRKVLPRRTIISLVKSAKDILRIYRRALRRWKARKY